MTNQLLTPFSLPDLTLKNRVVLAPMTRARAGKERTPNALMAEYYVQRANAGLIIAEATAIAPSPTGCVYRKLADAPGDWAEDRQEHLEVEIFCCCDRFWRLVRESLNKLVWPQ